MTSPTRTKFVQTIDTLSNQYLRGKAQAVRLSFIALLSSGHLLLEDIPGLGKTTLALVMANALGLTFGRIQCTSDLLPSDITGLSIFNREQNLFKFIQGPIFHNIVLVDEINRAMPKTQSAMLEAMEERRVTVEGVTYELPDPFLVIATQNPVEHVGTYPLPESQLDRFLIRTGIGYPPEAMERSIIKHGSLRGEIGSIPHILSQDDILLGRREVQQVHIADNIVGYIYAIISGTRNHPLILSGISTRGGISLADAARSVAYLEGRNFVIPEDVQDVVVAVGSHRLLTSEDSQSVDKEELLRSIVKNIHVPLL